MPPTQCACDAPCLIWKPSQNATVSPLRKDIAPGELHIAFRLQGVQYYVPSLFHLAPTHGKVISLSIHDVMQSKSLLEIYGVQGLDLHMEGYIMIHNYPVKEARITGRVLLCNPVSINKDNAPHPNDFLVISMDDFLGDQLLISVKVPNSISPPAIEAGCLLEITGTFFYRHHYKRQMLASAARVVGSQSDFGEELKWWADVLSIRRFLTEPWAYIPPQTSRSAAHPRFQQSALRAQRDKANILQYPVVENHAPAMDSFMVRRASNKEANSLSGSESTLATKLQNEVVDLTND